MCWCAVRVNGSVRGICFSEMDVYKSADVVVIDCAVDCKFPGLGLFIILLLRCV